MSHVNIYVLGIREQLCGGDYQHKLFAPGGTVQGNVFRFGKRQKMTLAV